MPMLMIGCDGGTNASSGIVPEVTRRLYELSIAGDVEQARDLQYRLLKVFDAMLYHSEFPDGFREALKLRGFDTGDGRQPRAESYKLELTELSRELQCLLAAEGFTDQPVGGCPAGEAIDPDQVAKIVNDVVGELKKRGIA